MTRRSGGLGRTRRTYRPAADPDIPSGLQTSDVWVNVVLGVDRVKRGPSHPICRTIPSGRWPLELALGQDLPLKSPFSSAVGSVSTSANFPYNLVSCARCAPWNARCLFRVCARVVPERRPGFEKRVMHVARSRSGRMRPGKRVWIVAVVVMMVLPSSVWKGESERQPEVRVVVREPEALRSSPPPAVMSSEGQTPRQSRTRTTRKRETPGPRRGA